MAIIIDGAKLAQEIRTEIKNEVKKLIISNKRAPGLAVIQIGADPASTIYVRNKIKACAEAGVESFAFTLQNTATEQEVLSLISDLNADTRIDGILCQLPLPAHIDQNKIIFAIAPDKDVDGFHPYNVGLLSMGNPNALVACTPQGCIKMLEAYGIPTRGKRAVVVGRSNIVGRPMASLLLGLDCTVTITHSHTPAEDLTAICRKADILIAATGKAGLITPEFVNSDQVILDVGISRTTKGKIVGDVDFAAVEPIVKAITPVPGGVGPVTIAMLLKNTLASYRRRVAD